MNVRPNLVGGYTILERLGRGGLSGVFRALRDSDGLEVALKITSLADLDPEFAEKWFNFVVAEVIRHHTAVAEGA